MSTSTTDKILIAVGLAIGSAVLVGTQSVTSAWAEPVLEACSGDSFEESGLHPYEPWLGGSFLCMLTQFLHELTMEAAGFITWVTLVLIHLPAAMLFYLEAGKAGARGPLKYPLVIVLLAVIFGVGVVMPTIWFPSYVLFKGKGAVTKLRVYVSVGVNLSFLVGTICMFAIHPDSDAWTWTISLFLGPMAAFYPLILSACPSSADPSSPLAIKQGAKACANAYLGMALLSFSGWVMVVFAGLTEYGTDVSALWGALWTNASSSVAFMLLDAVGYYVGAMCYLTSKNPSQAVTTFFLSPLLGPGCAVALTLARQELKIFESAAGESQKKKA